MARTRGIRCRSAPQTGLVYIPAQQNYTFTHDAAFTPFATDHEPGHPPSRCAARSGAQAAALRPRSPALAARSSRGTRFSARCGAPSARGAANGGVLSTAGGLVFQGTGTGEFMALDAANGKSLWSTQTQTEVIAPPMSYMAGGVQYVAIMVATGGSWAMSGAQANAKGNSCRISRVCSSTRWEAPPTLPAPEPRPVRPLAPPPATAPAATVARGEAEYRNYCGRCHGPVGAVNFGILPDLRYSAALGSKDTWAAVGLGGVLKANGMASFEVLDAEADAIRAYVIAQANAGLASERVSRR